MAGDWIKIEQVTPDKPEVFQMAASLEITPEAVVGHLIRLWIWADQQSINGHAISVTDVTLANVMRHADMPRVLREVGWLVGDELSLSLPNFERHNGETAKKRAVDRRRQAKHRAEIPSRSDRDKTVTREEKSIKKQKTTSSTKKPAKAVFVLPPEVDPQVWKDYCEHRESSAAMRKGWTDRAKSLAASKLAKYSHAEQRDMVDKSSLSGWAGLFEEKANGQGSGSSARNRKVDSYLDGVIDDEYGKGAI